MSGQNPPEMALEPDYPVGLRDKIAIEAMKSILSVTGAKHSFSDNIAKQCYDIADAMMTERDK